MAITITKKQKPQLLGKNIKTFPTTATASGKTIQKQPAQALPSTPQPVNTVIDRAGNRTITVRGKTFNLTSEQANLLGSQPSGIVDPQVREAAKALAENRPLGQQTTGFNEEFQRQAQLEAFQKGESR